ncbi:MAG: cell division protein SepF [Lachnospiraceae bacterium]
MGFFDSILNFMRLNTDDDDELYTEDYYDDDEEPVVRRNTPLRSVPDKETKTTRSTAKSSQKITPMRPSKKQSAGGMEVCVIKPTSFEDAREITETLLSSRTVILNVEGLDLEIAQRIIDFTSGSCFAISGNLQKISNYIFLITPMNVDISGDFQNLIDSIHPSSFQDEY